MGSAAAHARRQRPELQELSPRRAGWAALALAAAVVFYWIARSHTVYDVTTPDELGVAHVALRKAYSLIAFAIVGALADRALPPARRPALRAALVLAAFSAVIEVGQKLHGSTEGRLSNLVDVLCGAAGGWLGVALPRALVQAESREERR